MFPEKRKLEEAELDVNKRVKTEGDLSESLIRQIANEVDAEFTNLENDVRHLGHFSNASDSKHVSRRRLLCSVHTRHETKLRATNKSAV